MTGLNMIPVQESITEFYVTNFPGYDVIEDGLLDDEYLVKQSNKVKPYIVITHGMPMRSGTGSAFAGVRFDEYTCSFDVSVVAPTGKQVRKVMNLLHDKSVGWKPTGGGALIPYASGGPWAVYDGNGSPHVFTGSIRFEYAVNSEDPGAHIIP